MDKQKDRVTISVILDRSMAERIRVLAAKAAKSRSEWLRDFLDEHLVEVAATEGAAGK